MDEKLKELLEKAQANFNEQREKNEALTKQIADLQEKRVSDSQAYAQKMEQTAEGAVKAVRRLSRALGEDDTHADS